MSQQDLMHIFGFTMDDLLANRAGYMTQKQEKKFLYKNIERIAEIAIGVFLMGAIEIEIVRRPSPDTIVNFATISILIVTIVVGVGWIAYIARKAYIDIGNADVVIVTGKVSIRLAQTKGIQYMLHIKELEFKVPEKAKSLLHEGKSYHIYYAPHSKIILSIEMV